MLETTDAHFKRKFKSVPHSAELLAKIKFTLENDLYIYSGTLGTSHCMLLCSDVVEYLTQVSTKIETVLTKLKDKLCIPLVAVHRLTPSPRPTHGADGSQDP